MPVSVPEDYPTAGPGAVTTWALRTPEGAPVGTLAFNEGGMAWTFAETEHSSAQGRGVEAVAMLRSWRADGLQLEDALAAIGEAFEGDLSES